MIKKAGLFVISAAFLAYFISPVEEEPKPLPEETKIEQKTKSTPSDDTDYWGSDESEEEQEFVFGEPMVSTDPIIDTDESSDSNGEDEAGDASESAPRSSVSAQESFSRTVKSRPIHSSSPKPGELGSAENPIRLN